MNDAQSKSAEKLTFDDLTLDDLIFEKSAPQEPVILSQIEISSVKFDLKNNQWRGEIRLKAFDQKGADAGSAPISLYHNSSCISSGKTNRSGVATIRTQYIDLPDPEECVVLLEIRGKGVEVLIESRIATIVTRNSSQNAPTDEKPEESDPPITSPEEAAPEKLEDESAIKLPEHFINVEDQFMISKYQVTQKEYFEITGENPSEFKGDDLPVTNVSWFNAINYCNERSEREGLEPVYQKELGNIIIQDMTKNGYRLPTEEEWTYAARGGKESQGYRYIGSDNPDEAGWFENNSDEQPHPVGQKKPNELDLYDMSGNVWEWCWDLYDALKRDGVALPVPSRVLCGGAWAYGKKHLKPTGRRNNSRSYKHATIGFRCVRSISTLSDNTE